MRRRSGIDISVVILLAICFGAIVGFAGSYYYSLRLERQKQFSEVEREQAAAGRVPVISVTSTPTAKPTSPKSGSTTSTPPAAVAPTGAFNLSVPFFPQAPKKIWDVYHEDYCEEAALLGVHAYIAGKKYTTDQQEAELEKMREWEMKKFGYFESTSVEQTAQIAREFLGYKKVRIIDNPTIADIRKEVAAGRPVIVPANGKMLKNPYFKNGGPPYHMYVIRGFNENGDVITNDPGTQHGENFVYKTSVVLSSMFDWNNGQDHDKFPTGTPRVLVIE